MKKSFQIPIILFLLFIAFPCSTFAQGANCASAVLVNVNTNYGGILPSNNINVNLSCATIRRNGWVRFVATSSTVTITQAPRGSWFDPSITAYSGACGTLTEIGCVNAAGNGGTENLVVNGLTVGNTYYVRIGGIHNWDYNSWAFGTFSITANPDNDLCANATTLNCGDINVFGSNNGSSNIAHGTGCTLGNYGVWYTFVGDGLQTTIITSAEPGSDPEMAIMSGSCGSFSTITCEDDTGSGGVESYTINTVNGTTYYIYIADYFGAYLVDFTISRTCITSCNNTTTPLHTDLACPSVIAADTLGNNPASLDYCAGDTSIDLEATYLDIGDTSSYTVTDISGTAPPYNFGCLANQVSVDDDDVFSPVVNLPFTFCFYGQTYNSCVIGSNGIISFDTSLANSQSGWEINFNIPNAVNASAYETFWWGTIRNDYGFGPSIYGAHYDIDPRYGGEVGWELVTLDTGCRALIAAWNEVPLFLNSAIGDISKRYTSMMVLYENTNVIEIYIKEKVMDDVDPNTSNIWNNGRATIGLQNAASNAATAPPNRNDINTTWTATDEAWRFVPSGGSIVSLNWYEGSGTGGLNLGSTDIVTVNPAGTTTYTAAVTYTFCNAPGSPVTITDEVTVNTSGKRWNGGDNTIGPNTTPDDWNNPENWLGNSIPTINDCVYIPTTAANPNPVIYDDAIGYCDRLILQPNTSLTLESDTDPTNPQPFSANPTAAALTVQNNIILNGNLTLEDDASLVQISNAASNSGSGQVTISRNSAPVISSDYIYWSSPIANYTLNGLPGNATYQWLPTQANGTAGLHGNWDNASGAMPIGKGFIKRAGSNNANGVSAIFNGTITNLNNGNLSTSISSGTWNSGTYQGLGYNGTSNTTLATNEDDNFNLIGNPYPSSLNVKAFLTANSNIEGNVRVWTHGTPIGASGTDQFYQDYANNYSVNDYITYNLTGATIQNGFHGNIGTGQGFFVLMKHGETPNPGMVNFTNDMRYYGASPFSHYGNNQFYKTNNTSNKDENGEAHRIWFSLVSPDEQEVYNMLIGYIEGATNDNDRMFDAASTDYNAMNIFSILDNQRMVIQGRALPFNENDEVPIGVITTSTGIHTIGINSVDGLFLDETQNIFLADLELGIVHDLRANPYTFMATPGRHDRFMLRFIDNSLGIDTVNTNNYLSIIAPNNSYIKVVSETENIKSIEIYDLLGREIVNKKEINSKTYTIANTSFSNSVYIVKATLISGKYKIQKVVLRN
ncbi:MAG: T9SS type A sorting domain-containing protein [Oceanihabitans sp.]